MEWTYTGDTVVALWKEDERRVKQNEGEQEAKKDGQKGTEKRLKM